MSSQIQPLIRLVITPAAILSLGSCAPSATPVSPTTPPSEAVVPISDSVASDEPVETGTRILDQAATVRLLGAHGVTLQWIGWDKHGPVRVINDAGTIRLTASQEAQDGPGRLFLDGKIREIGTDHFVFDGTIRITDTPDAGRRCEENKLWHFAITQERPYWRLREFEWCDGLTDYVDIYF